MKVNFFTAMLPQAIYRHKSSTFTIKYSPFIHLFLYLLVKYSGISTPFSCGTMQAQPPVYTNQQW